MSKPQGAIPTACRVLVVDDGDTTRTVVPAILGTVGFDVRAAMGGEARSIAAGDAARWATKPGTAGSIQKPFDGDQLPGLADRPAGRG